MVMVIDAQKLSEFSSIVGFGSSQLLAGFVKTIGIAEDEEKAIIKSLKNLPDVKTPVSELLGKSPRLISRDWWV